MFVMIPSIVSITPSIHQPLLLLPSALSLPITLLPFLPPFLLPFLPSSLTHSLSHSLTSFFTLSPVPSFPYTHSPTLLLIHYLLLHSLNPPLFSFLPFRALIGNVITPQDIGVTYDMIGGLAEVHA